MNSKKLRCRYKILTDVLSDHVNINNTNYKRKEYEIMYRTCVIIVPSFCWLSINTQYKKMNRVIFSFKITWTNEIQCDVCTETIVFFISISWFDEFSFFFNS